MDSVGPWPAPDMPHLRHTRFRDLDNDLAERWVWEPGGTRWRYADSLVRGQTTVSAGTPTEADIARGDELARKYGW